MSIEDKIHKVDFILVNNVYIRRISIDGIYYYNTVDVQNASEMGKSRSQLRSSIYNKYSVNVNINTNTRKSRFLTEDGVKELLSRSNHSKSKLFLALFLENKANKVAFSSNLGSRIDIIKTQETFQALENYISNKMDHSDDTIILKALLNNVEMELKNCGILK